LADAARATRADLKVLFMTGYAENAAINGGFLDPGMELITKPFAVEALVQKLQRMLEGGRASWTSAHGAIVLKNPVTRP